MELPEHLRIITSKLNGISAAARNAFNANRLGTAQNYARFNRMKNPYSLPMFSIDVAVLERSLNLAVDDLVYGKILRFQQGGDLDRSD